MKKPDFFDDTLYKSAAKERLLTREEEVDLIRRAQHGDRKALDRMIRANVRLVFRFAGRFAYHGLDYEDLVQQGMLGLMKAVERFDLGFDVKFSTYAAWWIRHKLKRGLEDEARTIRIPVHRAVSVAKCIRTLRESLDRAPTDADIAAELGIDEVEAELVRQQLSGSMPSLDRLIDGAETRRDDPNTTTYKDAIPDESLVPEVRADSARSIRRASEIIELAMEALDRREKDVIRRRLINDPPETLAAIGRDYRISRERIRQLEALALDKMRAHLIFLELTEECADILALFGEVSDRPGYGGCVERSSQLLGPPDEPTRR